MRLSELTKPEIDAIVGNANFTEEELDVFYMAAGGKSIENISHKLSMSESTVSRRMKKILEKSGNEPQDKEHKMKALDGYIKELGGDITQLIGDMTAEERNLMRTKLSTLVSKL